MADYLELLERAANSPSSLIHRYRLLAAQGIGTHLFMEGDCDKYFYPSLVRHTSNDNVFTYEMSGHQGVLDAREEITNIGLNYKYTLFFVDSDLAKYLSDKDLDRPGVFYTSFYSVESYMYSEESIRIVGCDLDNLESTSDHVSNCWKYTEAMISSMEDRYRRFTAAILAAREAGQKPNLNNLHINKFVILGENTRPISPKSASRAMKRIGVDYATLDRALVRKWERKLASDNFVVWFRGKYLLSIFRLFVRYYFEQNKSSIGVNSKGKPFKCKMASMSDDNFSAAVLPRLHVPPDVAGYLHDVLVAA